MSDRFTVFLIPAFLATAVFFYSIGRHKDRTKYPIDLQERAASQLTNRRRVWDVLRKMNCSDLELLQRYPGTLFDDFLRGGATNHESAIFLRYFYQFSASSTFHKRPWTVALQGLPEPSDGPHRAFLLVPHFIQHDNMLQPEYPLSLDTQRQLHQGLPGTDGVWNVLLVAVLQEMPRLGTADPPVDRAVPEYSLTDDAGPDDLFKLVGPDGTLDLSSQLLPADGADIEELGGISLERVREILQLDPSGEEPKSKAAAITGIRLGPNFLYDKDLSDVVEVVDELLKYPQRSAPICVYLNGTYISNNTTAIITLLRNPRVRWVTIYDSPLAHRRSVLDTMCRLSRDFQKLIWIKEDDLQHSIRRTEADVLARHQAFYASSST